MLQRELPEAPESILALERRPGSVAPQIAEHRKAAEPRNQFHQTIVQPVFLSGRAKRFAQPRGNH